MQFAHVCYLTAYIYILVLKRLYILMVEATTMIPLFFQEAIPYTVKVILAAKQLDLTGGGMGSYPPPTTFTKFSHLIGDPRKEETGSIGFSGLSKSSWCCSSHCVISETIRNKDFVTSSFELQVASLWSSRLKQILIWSAVLEVRGKIWDLIDHRSLHKQDLTRPKLSQGMLFIRCDSNKSHKKNYSK